MHDEQSGRAAVDPAEVQFEDEFPHGVRGNHRVPRAASNQAEVRSALRRIQQSFREKALGDTRTPDEIIGYDEDGLPR